MRNYTEARKKTNKKWDAQNLDRMSYTVPKGQKATIQAYADNAGESVNLYTQRALLARMGLETWPSVSHQDETEAISDD